MGQLPTTSRRRAGDQAEAAVARHLVTSGWTVVARNVRVGRSELDIVAIDPAPRPTLVLVEVRSATVVRFGAPIESVDAAKVGRLYRAAMELTRLGHLPDGALLPSLAWRVDLITVVRDGSAGRWRTTQHLKGLHPP